ncbi:MAG: MarR family transcriptional regulator [Caulobacter sp.]|nr:MarR family transcriptional regulator [Caulobacter sp.]
MAGDDADLIDRLLADWRRERPDLDAAPLAVVGRVLHLAQALETRANRALKPVGLAYTDLDLLATLRRSGPPYRLTPTVLRRSVVLTSGAMTACLNRLEAQGLVAREPEPGDRRVLAAVLTPQGLALADRAIGLRLEEAADAVAGLEPAEREALAGLLRKLGAGLA